MALDVKRIRTEPHGHGAEGDERIRTAVCVHGAFDTNPPVDVYLGNRLACLADGEAKRFRFTAVDEAVRAGEQPGDVASVADMADERD